MLNILSDLPAKQRGPLRIRRLLHGVANEFVFRFLRIQSLLHAVANETLIVLTYLWVRNMASLMTFFVLTLPEG